LPIMFDCLVSFMTDQVSHFNSLGVKAICLCNPLTLEEETDLLAGKYSIVYGSPESWL
jgi:superfamily II DNA helicase RecQ